ncbi:MAG: RnfH family protein [Sulfuricella sp.]|nr:RnfH family protein [Sulfuricella sp.]
MTDDITVEVAYALPHRQTLLQVRVGADATVAEAIEQSGILKKLPELDPAHLQVGIYGKAATLGAGLRDKDRIEIYRPLIADPKEVRKKRAAEGKGDSQKDQATGVA